LNQASVQRSGLTLAPEAASERLQRVINKKISLEVMQQTVRKAFDLGWKSLKIYFMIGLPSENLDDIVAMAKMINSIDDLALNTQGKKPQIRVSVSTFVPKAHTAFERCSMATNQEIEAKQSTLRSLVRRSVKLSWSEYDSSVLEGVFSRGDRRLGRVLYRAWQMGQTFTAWEERIDMTIWRQAFVEEGLNIDFYLGQRTEDEVLPWEHILSSLNRKFLLKEYRKALKGQLTPNCLEDSCSSCGAYADFPPCATKQKSRSQVF